MRNRSFPVDDSTLSANALAEMLQRQYTFPGVVKCRFFRKGICDTYRVFAGDQTFYLKVYRYGRRKLVDVTEEIRLLHHLVEDGVSVAKPVMRRDGQFVSRIDAPEGARYSVLYESARGVAGDAGDDSRIKAFGHMVGRMHESLNSFRLPYRREALDMDHLVDQNLQIISSFMEHRSSDFALIESIAQECRSLSVLNETRSPVFGVCHGDLRAGDDYHPELPHHRTTRDPLFRSLPGCANQIH